MGFGEPGGEPADTGKMKESGLRAELVAVAGQCCLQHSSRIADLIMRDYVVSRRYPFYGMPVGGDDG